MSYLTKTSIAQHVTALGRWELVPRRALTFLKVMSILIWLKSQKRVAEAPLKCRRTIFTCDASATSTKTYPLTQGVIKYFDQRNLLYNSTPWLTCPMWLYRDSHCWCQVVFRFVSRDEQITNSGSLCNSSLFLKKIRQYTQACSDIIFPGW